MDVHVYIACMIVTAQVKSVMHQGPGPPTSPTAETLDESLNHFNELSLFVALFRLDIYLQLNREQQNEGLGVSKAGK